MRNEVQAICPKCNSTHVEYKSKAGEWECLDCESRFVGTVPQHPQPDTSRFLTGKTSSPKAIFFSYGHDANKELVVRFKTDLEKRGHTVWIDYKEIGTWCDWKGKITDGIHNSDLALAFLSKHATRDPGVCLNEIAMALNRFGTVYPILLEPEQEVTPPVTISHLQWQDLSQWKDIRDAKVDGKGWARWYEEKLIQIITLLEGDACEFEGDIRSLREVLKPLTFNSDITRHIPDFSGRKWVFDAYQDWLDNQKQSRLFWLKAGPGVGKTAIAAMLAHTYQSSVVGAWFCQASSGDRRDTHQALCSLAFQLAVRFDDYRRKLRFQLGFNVSTKPIDWDGLRARLMRKSESDIFNFLFTEPLANLIWREQRFVIVIDALDEATDENGQNPLVDLLVTRLANLPSWLNFVVTSRPNPDVVAKLQRFAPFELNTEDERNIADLKGYLHTGLTKREDFNALSECDQSCIKDTLLNNSEGMVLYLEQVLLSLGEGVLNMNTIAQVPRGLYSLYRINFDYRFGNEKLENVYDAEIRPLLRLLLAAPGPLPPDLAQQMLGWDKESYLRRRNKLGAYLLDTQQGCKVFHKTMCDWLIDECSSPYFIAPQPAKKKIAEYLWACFEEAEYKLKLPWPYEFQHWLADFMPLLPQWDDPGALDKLAIYLSQVYKFGKAEALLFRALYLREDVLGANDSDICASLNNIGFMLQTRGDYVAAEIYFKRSMVLHDKSSCLRDIDYAVLLNNLACLLHERGDDTEAKRLHLRALDIREINLGEKHEDVAQSLSNLAAVLRAKKEYVKAESLLRRAIKIRENILNAPQDLAISLNNLGGLLMDKGEYALAKSLVIRALEIRENVYGLVHPDVANSLSYLALIEHAMKEYEKSELLLLRALKIREETLEPDHPELAESLNNLGWFYFSRNLYDKAEPLYRRSLAIFEMTNGSESTRVADAHFNLGALMDDKGDFASAIPSFQRALAIREKLLGLKDPRTEEVRDLLTQCIANLNGISGMNRAQRRQQKRNSNNNKNR